MEDIIKSLFIIWDIVCVLHQDKIQIWEISKISIVHSSERTVVKYNVWLFSNNYQREYSSNKVFADEDSIINSLRLNHEMGPWASQFVAVINAIRWRSWRITYNLIYPITRDTEYFPERWDEWFMSLEEAEERYNLLTQRTPI